MRARSMQAGKRYIAPTADGKGRDTVTLVEISGSSIVVRPTYDPDDRSSWTIPWNAQVEEVGAITLRSSETIEVADHERALIVQLLRTAAEESRRNGYHERASSLDYETDRIVNGEHRETVPWPKRRSR